MNLALIGERLQRNCPSSPFKLSRLPPSSPLRPRVTRSGKLNIAQPPAVAPAPGGSSPDSTPPGSSPLSTPPSTRAPSSSPPAPPPPRRNRSPSDSSDSSNSSSIPPLTRENSPSRMPLYETAPPPVPLATVEIKDQKLPTLTAGDLTPKVLREYEDSCEDYFGLKEVPAATQVRRAMTGIHDNRIKDWINGDRARILAMTFKEFVAEMRRIYLPEDWATKIRGLQ
ncbi:hypothetical protein FPV67DRAFT_1786313 [Lyophyllum atratum]|nr:hypothetical protein FPV67DRAFT_1786313 [Lyophyllum atratum]